MPPASVPASDGSATATSSRWGASRSETSTVDRRILPAEPLAEPAGDLRAPLRAVLEDVRGGAGHARVVAAHAEPGDLGDRDRLRLAADPAGELGDLAEPESRAPATQRRGDEEPEQQVDRERDDQEPADRLVLAVGDPDDQEVAGLEQVVAGQARPGLGDHEADQQDREAEREPAPRRPPGARADVPAQAARDLPRGAQARVRRGRRGRGRGARAIRRRPPKPGARPPSPPGCPSARPAPTRSRRWAAPRGAAPRRAGSRVACRPPAAPPPRPAPRAPRAPRRTAASPRAARPTRRPPAAPPRSRAARRRAHAGSSPSWASFGSSSPNTMPPSAASSAAAPIGSIPGLPSRRRSDSRSSLASSCGRSSSSPMTVRTPSL